MQPRGLIGIHLNLVEYVPTEIEQSSATPAEQKMLADMGYYLDKLSGYYALQSKHPQSIAYSVSDSPVGQAAWIYQMLQDVSDSGGRPEEVFKLDDIIDDIMLYWLPNAGPSSARLYWKAAQEPPAL
jgi:microsomal epoxide hydrolase